MVLDAAVSSAAGWTVPDLARTCAGAGARVFQVRDKGASSGLLLALTTQVLVAVGEAADQSTVIVNDRPDVAVCAGAAGVHLGQTDVPPVSARRLLTGEAIVGRSTHTPAQIDAALEEPISYLAVGPVFETTTKDTGYRAVGLDLVRYAVQRAGRIPVVAIGGINLDRVGAVRDAGASAVAIVSDLFSTADVEGRVRAYLASW